MTKFFFFLLCSTSDEITLCASKNDRKAIESILESKEIPYNVMTDVLLSLDDKGLYVSHRTVKNGNLKLMRLLLNIIKVIIKL